MKAGTHRLEAVVRYESLGARSFSLQSILSFVLPFFYGLDKVEHDQGENPYDDDPQRKSL